MNFKAWKLEAEHCAARHEKLRDHDSDRPARRALIELHKLVLAAPAPVRDAYKGLRESDLRSEAEVRHARIAKGRYGWRTPASGIGDEAVWMTVLGAQIRALDVWLEEGEPCGRGLVADASAWFCEHTRTYLVPGKPPMDNPDGRPYERRGLRYHRILPDEINGYTVRLHLDNARAAEAPIRLGAALFADGRLSADRHGHEFVITDFTAQDFDDTIRHQVGQACAQGCFGVVWPELTLPPAKRELVAQCLRDHDGPTRPLVTVAGTWHDPAGVRWRNVGTVLDPYGSTLLTFAKCLPYTDSEFGTEAIERGDHIEVLVNRSGLVAFAICRDFCDLQVDVPYPQLDVDLILVPSLGNRVSADGHRANAKRAALNHDTRTFVVQQARPEDKNALGYVLPMEGGAKQSAIDQSVTWAIYEKPR